MLVTLAKLMGASLNVKDFLVKNILFIKKVKPLFKTMQFYHCPVTAPLKVADVSDSELVTYNVKELNRLLKTKGGKSNKVFP